MTTTPDAPAVPAPVTARDPWTALAADRFAASARNFAALAADPGDVIAAARVLHRALRGGHKVLLCGNGGSAADAQHLAAELVGRFQRDRAPLPALALTTDTSALTAIGNDYGFDQVFSRQVTALGAEGDALVGISTSGASRNVVAAVEAATAGGMATVALVGRHGGPLADIADVAVRAPSAATPRIQELHIAIGHTLCELLEDALR